MLDENGVYSMVHVAHCLEIMQTLNVDCSFASNYKYKVAILEKFPHGQWPF